MQQQMIELGKEEILFPIDNGKVISFDIMKFIRFLGQIDGITFWVTLGRGIQELESPRPYKIHVQPGSAGYATYMLVDEDGKMALGGHGHLQLSSVDKISFEVLPSCTCLPATYNIFFEDIALRSALLNVSFPVWWSPSEPSFYKFYPEAYNTFMQLIQHFGTALLKVDGVWINNQANMPEIYRMHDVAKQRFEKIYTKINYANQGKADVVVDPEYKQYVVRT
jgi:hypothetical protein